MMSSLKVDVSWSPIHENLFLTCKSDINLYRTEPITDLQTPKSHGMKISEDTFASVISTNSEHQYIKCIAWYPKPEPSNLVALGLANGRLVLTSFGKGTSPDPHRLCGKEFVPKYQRQCSYLAWNPVESNLLAEGLERHKLDSSILIWDVYQQQRGHADWLHAADGQRPRGASTQNTDQAFVQKPFVEIGLGETTLSLAWFSNEPQSLVAGMNNKFLRIFDLRDVARPQNVAYTKAVYGVKVDPLSQHRLASFHDSHISIWDTRNFEKPISTLSDMKNILKIAWSPKRSGLLASLTKESANVKLYDIQHSVVADEIEPPSAAERRITSPDGHSVSSFDWHPSQENRMLLVSPNGGVKDIRIFERIALSWSPDVYLTWVCSKQLSQAHTIKLSREANDDIAMLMRRRAAKGYGIQKEISENTKIVSDNPSLKNLWLWIKYMKDLTFPSSGPRPSSPTLSPTTSPPTSPTYENVIPPARLYHGIKALVCGDMNADPPGDDISGGVNSRSRAEAWSWQSGDKDIGRRTVFFSPERMKALELCGWTYSKEKATSPIIDKFEHDRQFEKAAAIAIFNLKMSRAIEVLYRGSVARKGAPEGNINLSVVAMALSGFSDERDTMWRDVSMRLSEQLKDSYLRNMFRFLTTDNDNYDDIVNDSGLDVSDRVAFACFYLPDTKLLDYIEKLMLNLTSIGDLSGILLTGFSRECLDLFQNYVDSTGDVQTAAVALTQALPNSDLSQDPRAVHWLSSYRELLDVWRMWHHRAELDVYRQSCDRSAHGTPWVQPQVFVSCNFCGKSVSFNSLSMRNRMLVYGGTNTHKPRVTSCPSCRKPLPRCALCLINMGTSGGERKASHTTDTEAERLAKFSDWFTWCQSCRHGGHAEHMAEWYRDHTECPVTGCKCKCSSLDAMTSPATDSMATTPS